MQTDVFVRVPATRTLTELSTLSTTCDGTGTHSEQAVPGENKKPSKSSSGRLANPSTDIGVSRAGKPSFELRASMKSAAVDFFDIFGTPSRQIGKFYSNVKSGYTTAR